METYNTAFLCDLVCKMTLALNSENSFSEAEKKRLAMAAYALDSTVCKDLLEKFYPEACQGCQVR